MFERTVLKYPEYGIKSSLFIHIFIHLFLRKTALNIEELKQLGITHVLNAAKGTKRFSHVDTNADYYKPSGIQFLGIPGTDILTFKIHKYFKDATEFIANAIGSISSGRKPGCVFVHCKEGISRSATLVLAYLVTYQDMNLTDAVRTVRAKRKVCPNSGFLQQLIDYSRTIDHCY